MKKYQVFQTVAFLVLLSLLKCAESAKFLGVFAMPGGSHYILASRLMRGLAEAGHDVTMISPFPLKDPPKNGTWKDVLLPGVDEDFKRMLLDFNLFEDNKRSSLEKMKSYSKIMLNWVNKTLHHQNVKVLLKSNEKFDAVLMESFMNEAHRIFAHLYKCPLILLSSTGANPMVNYLVGNPSPASYVPHFFMDGDFSNGMTFLQRMQNLFLQVSGYGFRKFYSDPIQNEVLRKAFPNSPHVSELNDYVSLILLNSHTSLVRAVPIVPNMVEIGGYHIDPPKKLPKDLQQFLDNAKDGVIYFSMGSNLKSKDMSEEIKTELLEVFRKLKQKILWKFEDEELPGKPDNVLIKSWMPQQDILAHPNIKLFITHGGLLSTTETIYHGVPILAIPVFADQFSNANVAVQNGYGLKIPYGDEKFNEETLTLLIQELLNNPKYRNNAKWRSKLYHDRPLKPLENAVYWIEYVIRHNGAKHLQVDGIKLPWYQYFMVDVVLFLVTAFLVAFSILKYMLKSLLCKNKCKASEPKKQKIH